MAIMDKQQLINEVQKELYDKLTQKDIDIVAAALADRLVHYDIERELDDAEAGESEDLIRMFIEGKRSCGCSEKTVERYRYIISRFMKYINVPLKKVTVYHIRGYMMAEKDRGIAENTLAGYRDVYMSLFGWLHRESLIQTNPCANLAPVKKKKEVRKPLSNVEIERLKEACSSLRDKAIISFLMSTGCRISEVCGLNIEDIDFRTMECTVLGKGNKERTVYLDPVALLHLNAYLEKDERKEGPLFAGKGNIRLQPGGVRCMLKKVAARAGVENVHPHRFRRTLATGLINRGMAIQEVARILGHEKIDTTMKYVYINDRDVKNNYRRYA